MRKRLVAILLGICFMVPLFAGCSLFGTASSSGSNTANDESNSYNHMEDIDVAVRFRYDRSNGNEIQIFKYSTIEQSGYFLPEWKD